MRQVRTLVIAALAVATALAGLVAPASGQVDVDVALDNPGGSRTLYVEDLAGNSLSDLDFGNARSMPFRVRVVDDTMDRSSFTVSASMTNLYRDPGSGSLDWDTSIASSDITVGSATDPLNVLDTTVEVEPVFDTVSTITDGTICTVLGLAVSGGACIINVSDVQGLVQTVPLTVDLSDLTNLPLLPQSVDAGAFTNPDYAGLAAAAPQPPGAPAATSRRLVGGTPVSDATVLSAVDAGLATVLGALNLEDEIDTAVLTGALRDAVGVTWDLLSAAQVTTVLNSTVATVQSVTGSQLIGQSGTYLSFPVVSVSVPSSATGGTYRGTLVVTGLE